ncbi:unnamed protein product [Cylindrotheca closterium]|uniref:Uncharacterized protein n=1 Tax=Cylindrotheca closterium TaxID=2856 RepID=A0AAD2PU72_9STRA|nr:unnamed protein product [Cylindrotheca closterium]
MPSKHVNFNDGSNSTKEFEKASEQEKGNLWYSKEEKDLNRKQMQAEAMIEHGKALVTKTVLEMDEYQGKTVDSEEVKAAVDEVLAKGVDGVIDFLAKNGKGVPPPTFTRRGPPAAASDGGSPTKFSVEENEAADEEARQQVRDLVKHQIVVLMQSGRVDGSSVSAEDLEKKADEIMLLPRMEILRFLEEKPVLPASKSAAKPPVPYNWINDGKHAWDDLPAPIQNAAKTLGYDEESWTAQKQPEKSDKVWEDLTDAQQEAAIRLGFNPYSWDGIEPSEHEESERHVDDSDSSSDSDTEGEASESNPEEAMRSAARDLVKQKLLEAEAFNEDNVDSTVDTVMELPRPQIMAFLQHPLPEHWTKPQHQDDTERTDDSEVGGRDSMVFSTFVLAKDDDDDKPMEDDSSSDEEEEPQKPLAPISQPKEEEVVDEFLANFLSDDEDDLDDDKENAAHVNNETTPLIPGGSRSLPRGDDYDDPKKPSSSTVVILVVGLGIAVVGWLAYKKMR